MDSCTQQSCLLYPHVVQVQYFSALSYSAAGKTILLLFTAMPSIIVISSMNGPQCCRFFCTSALVNGQLHSMSSDRMPMCSSCSVAILVYSYVMQSAMSFLDSWTDSNSHAQNLFIFVYLIVVLDSQFTMNSCNPCLYGTLMLYWCILNSILWSLHNRLATSFLMIATDGLWSVITLTSWVKQLW